MRLCIDATTPPNNHKESFFSRTHVSLVTTAQVTTNKSIIIVWILIKRLLRIEFVLVASPSSSSSSSRWSSSRSKHSVGAVLAWLGNVFCHLYPNSDQTTRPDRECLGGVSVVLELQQPMVIHRTVETDCNTSVPDDVVMEQLCVVKQGLSKDARSAVCSRHNTCTVFTVIVTTKST